MYLKKNKKKRSVCSLKENAEKRGVFVRFLKENTTVQRDVIVLKCAKCLFTVCFFICWLFTMIIIIIILEVCLFLSSVNIVQLLQSLFTCPSYVHESSCIWQTQIKEKKMSLWKWCIFTQDCLGFFLFVLDILAGAIREGIISWREIHWKSSSTVKT